MSDHRPAKEADLDRFAALAPVWSSGGEALSQARRTLSVLGFQQGQSLLDVAAGTGVILAALHSLGLTPGRYLAVDISAPMLEELRRSFPEAETLCADFELPFSAPAGYDHILIYNSIPHFTDLEMLFANAGRNLLPGGTFMIAHSRTREGLSEHHRRIGHIPRHTPIPPDAELARLAAKYRLIHVLSADDDFFYFSCQRP
ncbi:class I SAM-dependent methyltransferase [Paenibacillus tepidiphilus]|uniref:class I SAM-dependent methyltransferase n=1 Tax=Paenibacillus tepidiphilus TaxID=2608683 RepID=UPI0013A5A183|nr:class I SAM-dependent methyltransferase [Paenibacillus tepidiphilus]